MRKTTSLAQILTSKKSPVKEATCQCGKPLSQCNCEGKGKEMGGCCGSGCCCG